MTETDTLLSSDDSDHRTNGHSLRVFESKIKQVENDDVYRISYDPDSHLSVIFQMHGSMWPKVLPFAVANSILTLFLMILKNHGTDLTISPTGFKFMAPLVSFLLVTRNTMTYKRFMMARGDLANVYRSTKELVQHVCIFTTHDKSSDAIEWRLSMAYKAILLLRITIATLEFNDKREDAWDIMDIPQGVKEGINEHLMTQKRSGQRTMKWAHGKRKKLDENFRAPIIMSYELRRIMMDNRFRLKERISACEERELSKFISQFMTAFSNLRAQIKAPIPFPLVQMGRTFVFLWVFIVPFCLATTGKESLVTIFFITYAFLGVEFVSIEMDDPFGHDPNDFDDLGMAQIVFEDVYITIWQEDGEESADLLSSNMKKTNCKGNTLAKFRKNHRGVYNSFSEDVGKPVKINPYASLDINPFLNLGNTNTDIGLDMV